MLGEDSPAANILKPFSGNAITINRLDNTFRGPDCFFGRRLLLINQVVRVPFESLSQRLSSLMIGSCNFCSFIVILDLAKESAEKSFFHLRFDLRDDHTAVNLEVIQRRVSNSFRQWHAFVNLIGLLFRSDKTLNCVSLVGGC